MSANEDYIIQGLDALTQGITELTTQVETLRAEQDEVRIPATVTVAMESLKILSRSQKIVTRHTVERNSGVDTTNNEVPCESIHRYPRPLQESEAELRDVCCQLISGYLIQSLGSHGTD